MAEETSGKGTEQVSGQTSAQAYGQAYEKASEETSMLIRYWGVRGSIPSPLNTKYVRQKEEALIKKIIEDGGTLFLFDNNPNPEKIREYLASLPLSLSGTYGGDTTCLEVQVKILH